MRRVVQRLGSAKNRGLSAIPQGRKRGRHPTQRLYREKQPGYLPTRGWTTPVGPTTCRSMASASCWVTHLIEFLRHSRIARHLWQQHNPSCPVGPRRENGGGGGGMATSFPVRGSVRPDASSEPEDEKPKDPDDRFHARANPNSCSNWFAHSSPLCSIVTLCPTVAYPYSKPTITRVLDSLETSPINRFDGRVLIGHHLSRMLIGRHRDPPLGDQRSLIENLAIGLLDWVDKGEIAGSR